MNLTIIIITSALLLCVIAGLLIWWSKNSIITHKEYYDEDKKQIKRIYYTHKKMKCGEERIFYPTGELNKVQNWQNDVKNGKFTVFYKSGRGYISGAYLDGKYSGDYIVYDMDGSILKQIQY